MRQQLFQQLDTNSDGGIDETEFLDGAKGAAQDSGTAAVSDDKLKAAFSAFDADSDGKLTQSELSTGFQRLGESVRATLISQQEAGRSGRPQPPSAEDLMTKLDADQSGGVDEAEFLAGAPKGGKGPSESDLKAAFASFDTDGDGSLSADELEAGFESRRAADGRGHGGPGGPGGPGGAGGPPPQAAAEDEDDEENPFLKLLEERSTSSVNQQDLATILSSFLKLQQTGSTQTFVTTA
jgi:Ca2+-binding EF-hand superfamily protein